MKVRLSRVQLISVGVVLVLLTALWPSLYLTFIFLSRAQTDLN